MPSELRKAYRDGCRRAAARVLLSKTDSVGEAAQLARVYRLTCAQVAWDIELIVEHERQHSDGVFKFAGSPTQ